MLAETDLLDGRRATTHWAHVKEFGARFPKVLLDPDPIWLRDGNIYTSAGVTAGMDLALALVEEDGNAPVQSPVQFSVLTTEAGTAAQRLGLAER